jgi:hypothetical protein
MDSAFCSGYPQHVPVFAQAQHPIILQELPDSAFDDVGVLFYLEG